MQNLNSKLVLTLFFSGSLGYAVGGAHGTAVAWSIVSGISVLIMLAEEFVKQL